jgi:hypothetical protein
MLPALFAFGYLWHKVLIFAQASVNHNPLNLGFPL